jgi:hypothetical protein
VIPDPTPLRRRPVDQGPRPAGRTRAIRRAGRPVVQVPIVEEYRIEHLIRDKYLSREPHHVGFDVAPEDDVPPSHPFTGVFFIAIALLIPIALMCSGVPR